MGRSKGNAGSDGRGATSEFSKAMDLDRQVRETGKGEHGSTHGRIHGLDSGVVARAEMLDDDRQARDGLDERREVLGEVVGGSPCAAHREAEALRGSPDRERVGARRARRLAQSNADGALARRALERLDASGRATSTTTTGANGPGIAGRTRTGRCCRAGPSPGPGSRARPRGDPSGTGGSRRARTNRARRGSGCRRCASGTSWPRSAQREDLIDGIDAAREPSAGLGAGYPVCRA